MGGHSTVSGIGPHVRLVAFANELDVVGIDPEEPGDELLTGVGAVLVGRIDNGRGGGDADRLVGLLPEK